ncbi:DUF4956 domain-containing protein [Gaoshiqia sediminis]|uniref:DUF4956 domain-containing protein n=1 Tax=Gaoshiqia sediminis TaxID=2986998 RepID=A0AA41Y5D8_9BACT|nr:DUF4956 domain-containing protein [Gaoshiqia sediminis]MCW0483756.1 DUF4956 domain-containing protein [Gaoshiqia sediminis]
MNLLSILANQAFNEVAFYNSASFWDLIIRFSFNLLVTLIIVRFIYYKKTRRKDYLFTYLLINTMIFLLAYLLSGVELKLGFAFGLFALFGILRYRTNPVQIKEMTYLFVLIGVAVINSISDEYIPYAEVLLANLALVVILWVLEFAFLLSHESSKKVLYEKIELIAQNNHQALIEDLRKRTGINIHRVEIVSINFLRDTAKIIIYYYEKNKIFNVEDQFYPLDQDN